jgi:hypothetical protein
MGREGAGAPGRGTRTDAVITVVFETHSTSEDNERGIATGWLGGRLSRLGREQARALGERRRDDGIDLVASSDLNRAVETVQIAFGEARLPIRLDWRLRECNYGALNGMPRSQLEAERRRHLRSETVSVCSSWGTSRRGGRSTSSPARRSMRSAMRRSPGARGGSTSSSSAGEASRRTREERRHPRRQRGDRREEGKPQHAHPSARSARGMRLDVERGGRVP